MFSFDILVGQGVDFGSLRKEKVDFCKHIHGKTDSTSFVQDRQDLCGFGQGMQISVCLCVCVRGGDIFYRVCVQYTD